MFKKILSTVLVVAMLASLCVAFASCGGGSESSESQSQGEGAISELTVGVILIGNEGEGYTKAHMDGIEAAVEAMEAAGKTVYLGGNIGRPLLPLVADMTKDDFAVVELSSFQLFDLPSFAVPHRAALTNLTPNHLNWHVDMEEYTLAKTRIYANHKFIF